MERGEWKIGITSEGLSAGIYFALLEAEGMAPVTIRVVHSGSR
jgi:hypothetical protein